MVWNVSIPGTFTVTVQFAPEPVTEAILGINGLVLPVKSKVAAVRPVTGSDKVTAYCTWEILMY